MNLKPMPIGTIEDGDVEIKVYDHKAMLDYYPAHTLKVIRSQSEIYDLVGPMLVNAQTDKIDVKFSFQNTYGLNTILIGYIKSTTDSKTNRAECIYYFQQKEHYITKETTPLIPLEINVAINSDEQPSPDVEVPTFTITKK